MRWVLENLQLIIVIAGAIAYWLNQRQREKQGQPADYDEDGIPENRPASPLAPPAEDFDEEARTRRVQEEIRRKIAERRGQTAPPESSEPPVIYAPPARREEAPPPVYQDPVGEMLKKLNKHLAPAPVAPAPAPEVEQEVLARQRELEEKLRALEAEKRKTEQRAAEIFVATTTAQAAATSRPPADSWLAELQDPAGARRAMALREIIGMPVGLR